MTTKIPNISKSTIAVILGGGAGTRLAPLTSERSKPAVPIGGKYRLVDIPISNCMNSDVLRMFVLTQFNSASLNKHVTSTYQFSPFSKAFVDILAAEQTPKNKTWFQGTADAVRQILHHLEGHSFEYILILSGDQLYQMDFRKMLQNHIERNADISIATVPVVERDAPEFGIMKVQNGFITSFIEKPRKEILKDWVSDTGEAMQAQGKHYLASMGIYIFNRELLFRLLQSEAPEAIDFGKEIIPYSVPRYKVASYQYEGYWTDIGNIRSFYEANLALVEEIPAFNLFDADNAIYTRPRLLPPSKIKGTYLEKSMIADGCIVQAAKVIGSVIGIRTRLGVDTEIINSYIMGADFYETLNEIRALEIEGKVALGIGKRCKIYYAIIDKNCRIGDDVIIKGGSHLPDTEHELYAVKEGIVVVKKGAILPNGFQIGV
ncbi:MAG: glucose-1-phosphate adenylyltransferase [Microscillaceae bacterium]|nr:glucose-1-phosphate adenylyltransferase [Microscillaceae bacterium]MDW8460539.1 glucose-1-phosphate adenylyltransferase [Cytophagales bacterium]